jgi:hypothetical protein
MRTIRLRELRDILLRQLNFFRSIEKRIANDVYCIHLIQSTLLDHQLRKYKQKYILNTKL